MKKKILWLFMVMSMLLTFAPLVQAATVVHSGTCGDNLTWTLDGDGTLEISGTGEMDNYYEDEHLSFTTYDNPAPWARYTVRKVKINFGVTTIGDCAFIKSYRLTEINVPNTLTTIGSRAFYDCDKLETVNFPTSIRSIALRAFYNCSSLKEIKLPSDITYIGNSAFDNTAYSQQLDNYVNNILYCDNYLLQSSQHSISCEIKPDTTLIASGAFQWGEFEYISLPDSVKNIGESAFWGCANLKEITLPPGLSKIQSYTFNGCSSLTSIYIPKSVQHIDRSAFRVCSNLIDVYYGGSETDWDKIIIDNSDNENAALINATIHYADEPCFTITQTVAKAEITNTSDEQQSATVIIAKYSDNRLLQVSSSEITFNPNETKIYDTDNNTKVFVWDSLKGMRPLDKSL